MRNKRVYRSRTGVMMMVTGQTSGHGARVDGTRAHERAGHRGYGACGETAYGRKLSGNGREFTSRQGLTGRRTNE